jgi:hypothetical protein
VRPPLGDDRRQRLRVGGGLEQHLAADRQAEAADPPAVDVGAPLEEVDPGTNVLVEVPSEAVGVSLTAALAAPVVEQHAVAVRTSMRACLRAPVRPGKTMTAARFLDGTYQPSSLSPSLVWSVTSSWAAPSCAWGTSARDTCEPM